MQWKRGLSCFAGITLFALYCPLAKADPNDIVLSRLGTIVNDEVVGNNIEFRSLVSELGIVLAPRLLTPADTLGFGGFQFTADIGFTGINSNAEYWRVRESSDASAGADSHGSGTLQTSGVFMRKGIWLPLPSFEVGLGAVHVGDSRLWAAQGYAKFALHEGYHDLPIPSVAVRGAASRMMGSKDLDLTVASFDISMSKSFGVAGTLNIAPYGGWNLLIMIPRSEVIDKTPDMSGDGAMNFVFKDQDNITRNRFFAGVKLQYYVFQLAVEAGLIPAGSSVDDRGGTDMNCADATSPTESCDATDEAGSQKSFSFAVGLDF